MNKKTNNMKNQIKYTLVEKYKDYQKNEIYKASRKALKNVIDKKVFFNNSEYTFTSEHIASIDKLARLVLKDNIFSIYYNLSNNKKRVLLANALKLSIKGDIYTIDKKEGTKGYNIAFKINEFITQVAYILATDNGKNNFNY